MGPVDQIQGITAEYRALEAAHSACSDPTLKENLRKQLHALAQKITALSASMLKPAEAAQPAKKEEDDEKLRLDKERERKEIRLNAKYGSYAWIYGEAEKEIDIVALNGGGFDSRQNEAEIEFNRPFIAKTVMRCACAVLSTLGSELAGKKLEATCTFDKDVPYWFPVLVAEPLFRFIEVEMKALDEERTRWKFSWKDTNECLNWWNRGGKAVCLKRISDDDKEGEQSETSRLLSQKRIEDLCKKV